MDRRDARNTMDMNKAIGGDIQDFSEILGVSAHCIDGRKATVAQLNGLMTWKARKDEKEGWDKLEEEYKESRAEMENK